MKQMKRIIASLMAVSLLAATAAGCGSQNNEKGEANSKPAGFSQEKTAEEYQGTVVSWTWFPDYYTTLLKEFNSKFPNIKVEVVPVQSADYTTKLQSTLASGGQLPDVLNVEIGFRAKIMQMDILDTLNAKPYEVQPDDLIQVYMNSNKDADGNLLLVDSSIGGIGGVYYRRDLTKEYLGTDEPEQLAELMPTWDKFIEAGKTVKEKSGDKVSLVAGLSDVFVARNGQINESWIGEDSSIKVEELYRDSYDLCKQVRDNGLDAKLEMWTPEWNASFGSGEVMFFPGAHWYYDYLVMPNDAEGSGRWGLMPCPDGPFNNGGTSWGICKQSTDEAKELSYQLLKWAFLSKEGAQYIFENVGQASAYIPSWEEPYYDKQMEFFGNQPIYRFFFDEIDKMKGVPPTSVHDEVRDNALNIGLKALDAGNGDIEGILKEVRAEIEQKLA